MSHRIPISGWSIREPKIYQNLVYFTRIGDFTWRVSGSEELVVTLKFEEYLNLRMKILVEQKLNRRGKHTITGN